jgi:hypothetical protein
MFPILGWGFLDLVIFCTLFITCVTHVFYLRHFIFILQHLVLIVRNTLSHILKCMLDEIIKRLILILHVNQKTFFYPKNKKVQTYNKSNTLMRVFYKHHGLNYFGPSYRSGITYAQNYSMHMQYPY